MAQAPGLSGNRKLGYRDPLRRLRRLPDLVSLVVVNPQCDNPRGGGPQDETFKESSESR
jgi:hypothetical protein